MSYYRKVYLQSDEWKSLRLIALVKANFTCAICGERKMSRDVHHLKYKNLWDVSHNDLKVLCRSCHDKTHILLDKYPKLKKLPKGEMWRIIMQRLSPVPRRSHSAIVQSKRLIFGRMRDVLCSLHLAKRRRMVCHPKILQNNFVPIRKNPLLYLKQYIAATGIDPRCRRERIGPHKLLTWSGK